MSDTEYPTFDQEMEGVDDGNMEESNDGTAKFNGKTSAEKKVARTQQKELLKERKATRPFAPIIQQAKVIWEDLRQKRLTKTERKVLMEKMMSIVTGKSKDIIFKHDASRIIQCCMKYGTPEQRNLIAGELENNWVALSQSKYARFIVSSTLKYCAGYRSIILKEFQGKVCKLVKHKEASLILDELYSQYANSTQRLTLMEEFYGPEFVLFKQVFLFNKAEGPKTIVDIIASNPSKQPFILKHLRNTLDSVLQKGTFNLGRTPILHKAIWDYLSISESKVSADMIELLKDHLVHILHTREGAKIAQYCLVHSGPKDRKQIIKSFKGFVHSIAKEKYGHMVLISAFECVDDTVLMGKSIVSELFKPPNAESNVFDLLIDQYGSRVILYLLTGRNKHHQPIFAINELGEFDSTRALTTKKEDAVRAEQLLEVASPLMIAFAQQSANTLMRDKIGGQVLLAILQYGKGDVQPILDTIISSISENLNMPDKQDQEIAEFHPIKKMRSEKEASKRASQGLLMHESLLFNRNSTFFIKNALSKKLESEWQLKFINDLWETVEPHFDSLLDYCILNHSHSAGTSLIFVAIWEFGESAINKKIRKLCKTKTFAATESVDDNGKRKQSDSTPAIKVLIDNACA